MLLYGSVYFQKIMNTKQLHYKVLILSSISSLVVMTIFSFYSTTSWIQVSETRICRVVVQLVLVVYLSQLVTACEGVDYTDSVFRLCGNTIGENEISSFFFS